MLGDCMIIHVIVLDKANNVYVAESGSHFSITSISANSKPKSERLEM